ncbi:MAG: ABC transporter ATP-binding protein, partial [Chitinophagaceae bacterium]
RYSSGMYVRLAFAVAAYLEPDILIVDEVLAVGDAEFQKKALGKMKEVSNQEGRTVLFVSHNMSAIQNLCERLVYLSNGTVKEIAGTTTVINSYLSSKRQSKDDIGAMTERTGNGDLKFTGGYIKQINSDVLNTVDTFSDVVIELRFQVSHPVKSSWVRIDIGINNLLGDRVGWLSSDTLAFNPDLMAGTINFYIKNLPFAPGTYTCNLFCEINNEVADWVTEVMEFSVTEKDYYNTGRSIISNQGDVLLNYKVAQ